MAPVPDASDDKTAPSRWFIGVGVGEYDDSTLNLKKALSDVGRMTDWFVNNSRVEHRLALKELSANPTWHQISKSLRKFLNARCPEDVVVIYIACHGDFYSGEAYLFGRDTPSADIAGDALSAGELGRMLGSSSPHNVLVIVDACVAGTIAATIADAARTAVRERNSRDSHRDFALVIIASAFGLDPAVDGEFVEAFLRTVCDERWTGTVRPWIDIVQLIVGLNAELDAANTGQSVECSPWFNGDIALIPNPNVGRQRRGGLFDDEEFAAHFDPAGRGVSRSEAGSFFTGRTMELRRVSEWLDLGDGAPEPRAMFVITGSPGSGKSALLSRITVLSQPGFLPAGTDVALLPAGTVPRTNSIDGVVWCHGKTRGQLIGEIGKVLGGGASTRDALLGLAQAQGSGKIVAVDALDEAAVGEAEAIATEILAPLASRTPLRLIIATRRHAIGGGTCNLLDRLVVQGRALLDLDVAANRTTDMVDYVQARLVARDLAPSVRSIDRDAAIVDMAKAIAKAAGKSFLVASIAARSTAMPLDLATGYRLPAEVGEALAGYLRGLENAEAVRDVLRPLAWALGAGQPWGTIWPALAAALADGARTISEAQVAAALNAAGDLVVEADDRGEPVYRLFHEALAEHLRETTPDRATAPARIARVLLALSSGRPWPAVPRYSRNNLPAMLVRAEMPDELARVLLDPAWARQQLNDAGGVQDPTYDVEAAAALFVALRRPLDLAPLCHQYSRATAETLPPLIEVLALGGQQRRAEALAANLIDVVDRMLAYRGLASVYAADGDYGAAGRCAEEVERTLAAMHPDHRPMAWCWSAEAFASAQNLDRAVQCAREASAAVSQNDDWDLFNGLFWAAMAARAAGEDGLRQRVANELEAGDSHSFGRNQMLQAASVAGCRDLLRSVLADRLAKAREEIMLVRHGNLALALADARMDDEMARLVAHVGANRPPGEDDSLKRWAWALALSGRLAQALDAMPWIGEPVERSKAIARISPIVAEAGDVELLARLRAVINGAMPSDEPRTQARLIRALWTVGAHEEALTGVERAIGEGPLASFLIDTRAEELRATYQVREKGPKMVRRSIVKTGRRAMTTSRAPVVDQVKSGDAEFAARQGELEKAREIAAELAVPQFKARALAAIARNEPNFETAISAWTEALVAARRAGRGEVELLLPIGPDLLRRAGRDDEARTLEQRVADIDTTWQLALFIDEYSALRVSMAPGPDRTRLLTSLMLAPVQLARAGHWSEAEIRAAWDRGEDGSRLFAVGLMQGDADLIIPDVLVAAIRASRSAFEQYSALKAIDNVPVERSIDASILQAIDDEIAQRPREDGSRAWLEEGSDRRRLVEKIRHRRGLTK